MTRERKLQKKIDVTNKTAGSAERNGKACWVDKLDDIGLSDRLKEAQWQEKEPIINHFIIYTT